MRGRQYVAIVRAVHGGRQVQRRGVVRGVVAARRRGVGVGRGREGERGPCEADRVGGPRHVAHRRRLPHAARARRGDRAELRAVTRRLALAEQLPVHQLCGVGARAQQPALARHLGLTQSLGLVGGRCECHGLLRPVELMHCARVPHALRDAAPAGRPPAPTAHRLRVHVHAAVGAGEREHRALGREASAQHRAARRLRVARAAAAAAAAADGAQVVGCEEEEAASGEADTQQLAVGGEGGGGGGGGQRAHADHTMLGQAPQP